MLKLDSVLAEGDFRILSVEPLLTEDDIDVLKIHDAEREQVVVGLDSQGDALHLTVPELVGTVRQVHDIGIQGSGLKVQRFHDLGIDEIVSASGVDEHHHLSGHHFAS